MYIFSLMLLFSLPFLQNLTTAIKQDVTMPKKTVVTTVFWVGETGSAENGNIANLASAWDENWQQHFGGVDDPVKRNGYQPAAFKSKENTFYFALPYNDISEAGVRKATAKSCSNAKSQGLQHYSWCKNSWIAISYKDKIAYAQWEDVGPYLEDDSAYVFGSKPPANRTDAAAGLDVSPAVRDYLGLNGLNKTSWWFVDASKVPNGPWKNVVTSNKGDSLD